MNNGWKLKLLTCVLFAAVRFGMWCWAIRENMVTYWVQDWIKTLNYDESISKVSFNEEIILYVAMETHLSIVSVASKAACKMQFFIQWPGKYTNLMTFLFSYFSHQKCWLNFTQENLAVFQPVLLCWLRVFAIRSARLMLFQPKDVWQCLAYWIYPPFAETDVCWLHRPTSSCFVSS